MAVGFHPLSFSPYPFKYARRVFFRPELEIAVSHDWPASSLILIYFILSSPAVFVLVPDGTSAFSEFPKRRNEGYFPRHEAIEAVAFLLKKADI
jgi:hypothetical protein